MAPSSKASSSKASPASPKKVKSTSLKAQLARQQPDGPQQTSLNKFFTSPNKPKSKADEVIEIDDDSDSAVAGRRGAAKSEEDDDSEVEIVSSTTNASQPTAPSPEKDPWAELRGLGKDSDLRSNGLLGTPIETASPVETTRKRKRHDDDESKAVVAPKVDGTVKSKPTTHPVASSSKLDKLIGLESLSAGRKTAEPDHEKVKSEAIAVDDDDDDVKPDIKPVTAEMMADLQNGLIDKPYGGVNWDVDSLIFRPEHVDIRKWPGGRLPYEVLVGVYVQVGATRSRLAIVRIITNFLRTLIHHSTVDLLPAIYLLSNHLAPSYVPLELGVGSSVLGPAVREVSGVSREAMKRLWDKWGDPGDVAFEAKGNVRTLIRPTPLVAYKVFEDLKKIARTKGTGAAKAKGDIVRKLLVQAKGEEVRYLVRTLVSHIRIGAVRLTLLAALSRAFVLTRPQTATQWSESLHATKQELDVTEPLPEKGAKGKGKAKADPAMIQSEEARQTVEAKLVAGTAILRRVYVRHPNYDDIMQALLEGGLDNLAERVPLSVGIPLSPMLGSITRSLEEVFTRLGDLPFTAEAKLDGQRVQIHARLDGPSGKDDGGGKWAESKSGKTRVWVRLFSRHLEDMTEKYPDICSMAAELLERHTPDQPAPFPTAPKLSAPSQHMLDLLSTKKLTSFVIDAEVVAIDKDNPEVYKSFQDLSNRAKKDVKIEDIKVIVGVFSFDLMLVNDEPLLNQPFSIRRHLLRTLFPAFFDPNTLLVARFGQVESIDSTAAEDVQAFFQHVVSQKCEGLMIKLLESGEGFVGDDADSDEEVVEVKKGEKEKGGNKKPLPSTYEPDARSQGWLKVKKDYLEGVGDSLDLVPIGAWWGMGRKAGWYSPFLLACLNPETGALEAVCKCISGFTDAFYKEMLVKYPAEGMPEKCNKVSTLAYYETGGYRPDFWFAPNEVWEIRCADISLSPVYPAAASHLGGERGLSIRFPRFMKIRTDKTWEEATTSMQLADLYRKQIEAAPAKAKPEELAAVADMPDDLDA